MSEKTMWWKKRENIILVLKMLLTFIFPLFLCVVYCLREGAWIGELYLASAQNNDTLFYYKQVEGMVKYGIPQGYFGFNESSAEVFSFASWSPLVLLPWTLWGKIFGWNFASPIICNIFLFSLVLTLFVYWVSPTWKQMLAIGVMIGLFPATTRYLMSCLAESNMVTMVLLFYAISLWYVRKEHQAKIIAMFVIAAYLTCIRPYMVILFLLPGLFWYEKKHLQGAVLTICTMLVCLLLYFAIGKWFTAEYFQGLYNWDVFSAFKEYGFEGGIYNLIYRVRNIGNELIESIVSSFKYGTFLGANYCVMFLVICIMAVLFVEQKRENKRYSWIIVHYLGMSIISVGALLFLMQKVNETSRHIMSFILVGMVLIGSITTVTMKKLWRVAFVAVLCIYLYHIYPDDGWDYQVPILQEEYRKEQEVWKSIGQDIDVITAGSPSFDNTLIWVFSDKVGDEIVYMSWQHMLALPPGMGISCCEIDYLLENWDNLQSRYITALSEGEIAGRCELYNYEKIGEADGKVIYKRY